MLGQHFEAVTLDHGVVAVEVDVSDHLLRVNGLKPTQVPKTGKRVTERWWIVDHFCLNNMLGDMLHEVFHLRIFS